MVVTVISKYKNNNRNTTHSRINTKQSIPKFNEGDLVFVDGMDITGKVNAVNLNGKFDLLVRDVNGNIKNVEGVSGNLLRKVKTSLRD